ncbi:MAG: putative colanic acid biosynthesis acetyltransferase [Colwellia sp.]|nr:putative colanic acid biosynthesis acetyltransferase [Colwellia sp.]
MNDLVGNRKTRNSASFSLSNRCLRLFWNVIYFILIRYTPKNLNLWRIGLYKLFGAKIHKKVTIYPKAKVWIPWNLVMEEGSCIANDTVIYNQGMVYIRKHALISQAAHICTGTHNYETQCFDLVIKAIEIGEHSWVAAEAFVGPGVKVGEGAVLGARAVAFKELEAWGVYTGNPAIKVKIRKKQELWT